MIVWSYGGGTQSIAILVLIAQGRLPKPDMVVMSDTGREASETFEYHNLYARPIFDSLGLTLEIAPHSLATVDLYTEDGECLLPAFSSEGRMRLFCSDKWKKLVVRRYLKQRGVKECEMWYGISRDECERMKVSDVQWITNRYPLCYGDTAYTRHDCKTIVERFGLPTPPRSSCWMCPNRNNEQWLRLKEHYTQDWTNACALDAEIRERDEKHELWLHKSRIPLADADLTAPPEPEGMLECASGMCWV